NARYKPDDANVPARWTRELKLVSENATRWYWLRLPMDHKKNESHAPIATVQRKNTSNLSRRSQVAATPCLAKMMSNGRTANPITGSYISRATEKVIEATVARIRRGDLVATCVANMITTLPSSASAIAQLM